MFREEMRVPGLPGAEDVTDGSVDYYDMDWENVENGVTEEQMAKWTAIRYTADHILDYIEVDDLHAIFEVEVPESWLGKSVGQLDIRKKYNINIAAIKQNGHINVNINPDTVLTGEMTMLVLGEYKALQKYFHL